MPHVTDERFRAAYCRARARAGDSSPGVKTQAALHGRKFNFRRQRSAAAAVRVEETFRRLATRPVVHAESEPGAGNGELGRAPLADITGFEFAMDLPPASSAVAGDAERRRKILAAVGAVVAFAAAKCPNGTRTSTGGCGARRTSGTSETGS